MIKINIEDNTPKKAEQTNLEGLHLDKDGDVWLFVDDIAVCFYRNSVPFWQNYDETFLSDYGPFRPFVGKVTLEN